MALSSIKNLLLGAGAIALTACASTGTNPPVASAPSASKSKSDTVSLGRPAMWRVSDVDSEIFLFGTFHVLPLDVEWKSVAYNTAMKSSETTIIEADTTSPEAVASIQSAVREYGLNPEGVTLSETLGKKRAAQLNSLAQELGVPMAGLEPMRPWFALIALTQVVFQKANFDPAQGVEAFVLAQAESEGDALVFLETAAFQIEALASLDGEEMFANFDTTIDQFSEFDTLTARLLEAWRTGDIDGIERDILNPLRDVSPGAYATLFTKRNKNWTDQIEKLLAKDDDYFIAVGAGHLVGAESVVTMLRAKGHKVERVQ